MYARQNLGITLIALIITVIVMLILAGVAISAIGNGGLIEQVKKAADLTNQATQNEQVQINDAVDILNNYPNGENNNTNNNKLGSTDGSWDGIANTPELMTGMTAVAWDSSGNEITPTTKEEWYNYAENRWANAVTKDSSGNITGYWVWIPRYAYKIESNLYTSNFGKISVKFLQGATNKDSDGNTVSTTYPSVSGNAMTDYVVHPSFINGTANDFANGEWDKELSGFWVAKYVAGFQASSIDTSGNLINGADTVKYSSLKYTAQYSSDNFITNALSQDLTAANYMNTNMSYPVFKPQTYAYNIISPGDAYSISQEIKNANSFYGFNNSETDSHQMKNSEWGAVVYLTQSQYGRNGTEPSMNSLNLNNKDNKNIYAVTGFAGTGAGITDITKVSGYNTPAGLLGSSTGNITGVYDLNGCIWEYVTSYIENGDVGNTKLQQYATSYATSETSTKYATVYPYATNSNHNNASGTIAEYGAARYGDAIMETANIGGTTSGWNSDTSIIAWGDGGDIPMCARRRRLRFFFRTIWVVCI